LDVNAINEKKLSNMRTTSADDELIEVTPKAIRLRKRVLKANETSEKIVDAEHTFFPRFEFRGL
jgi:predicted membrane GTPase involved in stress response